MKITQHDMGIEEIIITDKTIYIKFCYKGQERMEVIGLRIDK